MALGDGSQPSLDVQVGINDTANDRIAITLGELQATTLGVDTGAIDRSTATGAQAALTIFDSAIDTVNGYRSDYGAAQNRLESAMRNLETYTQNLASAESQIRDADFAFESAQLPKYQTMQQADVAILGQSNSINQGVVQLLQ